MRKIFAALLSLLILFLGSVGAVFAARQSYEAEGIYYMGGKDTVDGARDAALQDAKRLALEQAGSFLTSFTETLNGELVADQVTSFAAGVIKLDKIISEQPQLNNNQMAFVVKARFIVDSDDFVKKMEALRQSGHLEETIQSLSGIQKRYDVLLAENNLLKQQIAQTSDPLTKSLLTTQIDKTNNSIAATQWFEKGFNAADMNVKIEAFTLVIALDPLYLQAYLERGAAYLHKRERDLAIADADKAIFISPNSAAAYTLRAFAHGFGLSPYTIKAIADADKAISLDENYVDAYVIRGNCYWHDEKYDLAIADCNKALSLNPNRADVYTIRAYSYARQGKKDLALADFERALAINPQYANAVSGRDLLLNPRVPELSPFDRKNKKRFER